VWRAKASMISTSFFTIEMATSFIMRGRRGGAFVDEGLLRRKLAAQVRGE